MLQHYRCVAKGWNRLPAWQLKVAVALFLILLSNNSQLTHAATACDFTLPPLSFFTSLTHTANFPPDALAAASSRYLWSCQMSAGLNELSTFKVDANVHVEVSGMLLAAAQQSDVLNVEVVMSDPLSDSPNSEWIVKSEALLSYTSKSYIGDSDTARALLSLKFSTRACGCVKRLRFIWTPKAGALDKSCEVPAASQEAGEHGACAPFWAYSSVEPTCKQYSQGFSLNDDSHQSNICHPVRWETLPPPKLAVAASFNGNCRLGSLCANFVVVAPTLRTSTREAALPADLALVEKWRQTSQQLSDPCSSSTPGSASRQHANPNLEAPGGALVMESLIHTGMYAPTETLIFHHIILRAKEWDMPSLVVDVGANVAYFSLLALSLGCRVIALEPALHMMPYIRASLSLNPPSFVDRFTAIQCAAGSEFQAVDLRNDKNGGNSDWGVTYITASHDVPPASLPSSLMCQNCSHTFRLDSILKEPVLLLKIDTEGYELSVLQGVISLLESRKVLNIIAELKPPRRLETIEFLKGYGFQCIRYMERYNGFWSSDTSISISEDYRFNIHHPYAETGSGIWGLSCDAEVPADMDFEDHWFVREDAEECFWGSGNCEGVH